MAAPLPESSPQPPGGLSVIPGVGTPAAAAVSSRTRGSSAVAHVTPLVEDPGAADSSLYPLGSRNFVPESTFADEATIVDQLVSPVATTGKMTGEWSEYQGGLRFICHQWDTPWALGVYGPKAVELLRKNKIKPAFKAIPEYIKRDQRGLGCDGSPVTVPVFHFRANHIY